MPWIAFAADLDLEHCSLGAEGWNVRRVEAIKFLIELEMNGLGKSRINTLRDTFLC